MATFANVVTDALDDVTIEVSGGGAATLHMVEVARGNLDLSMTSPVVYNLMSAGKAMYAKTPEAPELAENLQLLMWYPYGAYHFAVRADSDIKTLDDIEGATVFLGPTGGGAYNGAKGWVEATTGLVAGEDYDAIKANWQTGFQAFLDGKIDMYVNGCLDPSGQFIQVTDRLHPGGRRDETPEYSNSAGQAIYEAPAGERVVPRAGVVEVILICQRN